uniref:E2 ubiquitin-conjugating enzyme n=1 Tax=Equus caballus TaxID=9796 RepID=A0A3Q2ICB2_HORSE
MTASKRVAKELEDLQKQLPRYLRDLFSDDADVLVWHALLLPEKPPYNLKAFKLRINFPEEYPFRPPTVKFTTKIYHPNVDSDGQVCLPIISNENWKPCTKTCQVLEALNVLVNTPDLGQPLRDCLTPGMNMICVSSATQGHAPDFVRTSERSGNLRPQCCIPHPWLLISVGKRLDFPKGIKQGRLASWGAGDSRMLWGPPPSSPLPHSPPPPSHQPPEVQPWPHLPQQPSSESLPGPLGHGLSPGLQPWAPVFCRSPERLPRPPPAPQPP